MIRYLLILSLAATLISGCQGPEQGPVPGSKAAPVTSSSSSADLPQGLLRSIARVRQQEAGTRYALRRAGEGYLADNPAEKLSVRFQDGAVSVSARDGSWSVGLELIRWGREGAVLATQGAEARAERNRLTYRRARGMEEWYLNGPLGLEQGFTIQARPGEASAGQLVLELAVSGPLSLRVDGGRAVTLHDLAGQTKAVYRDLWVEDAQGRGLEAQLTVSGAKTIRIQVDDAGAVYPIVVDPMLMGVINKVTAADGSNGDHFGVAAAIQGTTAIIGSVDDDDRGSSSGSAYIFSRSGHTWLQQQKLTASDGTAGDNFGTSVALNGGVVVVGALNDDDKGASTGAAYVFSRNGTVWSQQQKLLGLDSAAGDQLGLSVAVSGESVLLGTPYGDQRGSNSGAAYLFARSGTTWSQQKKLTAGDGAKEDYFGYSVSLYGGAALVGAFGEDQRGSLSGSAYIFTRSGTAWSQQKKLTASDGAKEDYFGQAVSLSQGVALVGAQLEDRKGGNSGSAYIFTRSGTAWGQQKKLTAADGAGNDRFGRAVSVDNKRAVVGAYRDGSYDHGSAYLFARSGNNWTQKKKLTAQDWANYDRFGLAVGISGSTVLVGAYQDDDKGSDSGSAHFIQLCDTADPKKIKAIVVKDEVSGCVFQHRIDCKGDDKGSNSGSAYVFVRTGSVWGQQQKLVASNGSKSDHFGYAVAVSGDTVLVGARDDDPRGSSSGSAYVYLRTGTSWSQQRMLTAFDGSKNDYFGQAVSISGDTALLGAPGDDDRGSSSGSAYLFIRSGVNWSLQRKLTASAGASSDYFGHSVALSGDTALIGSYGDDDRGSASGSAHVYRRVGTAWSIQQKLTASNGGSSDYFGFNVSLSGDLALVGAYLEDARGSNAGAAYVFSRSGTQWTQAQKLTAQDGASSDYYGYSVSVSGANILVGAYAEDERGSASGSAYLYKRSGSSWVHHQKHFAPDGSKSDYFGWSVAMSGNIPLVGAWADDDLGTDSGSAYLLSPTCKDDPGGPCTSGSSCPTGLCVDGVCCDKACGGGVADCQACSVAAGAVKNGVCGPVKQGSACRAASGLCDSAESCDGIGLACPADKVMPNGHVCRGKNGDCDSAESCNGTTKACPANAFLPASTVCRGGTSTCDMAEFCSGGSATCPADALRPSGYVCRASSGGCDVPETCSGSTSICPADKLQPVGSSCRASAGVCDLAESCTGSSKNCPADNMKSAGTICRGANGACDKAESCTGSIKTCPADTVQPYAFICRAAVGACDEAEQCNGTSKACPADATLKSGTTCRAASGACDKVETCNGTTKVCPANAYLASGVTCRQIAGLCDVSESCTGGSPNCPQDSHQTKGAACRPAAGVCDLAELCLGSAVTCPKNIFVPNGTSCQSGKGTCQGGKCLVKPDAGVPDSGVVDSGSDSGGGEAGPDAAGDGGKSKEAGNDGQTTDSVASPDTGATPPGDESGCDCRVGSNGNGAPIWLLAFALLLVRRRR